MTHARSGCGCGGCLTRSIFAPILIAIIIAYVVWHDATDVAPWAYGKGSHLTGTWVGQFHTPKGQSGTVMLKVYRQLTSHGHTAPKDRALLHVSGRICGVKPGVQTVTFDGTANRTADDIALTSAHIDSGQATIGMAGLHGVWLHDSLRVTTVLLTPQHQPDSTTIVLRHARPPAFYDDCRLRRPPARSASPQSY